MRLCMTKIVGMGTCQRPRPEQGGGACGVKSTRVNETGRSAALTAPGPRSTPLPGGSRPCQRLASGRHGRHWRHCPSSGHSQQTRWPSFAASSLTQGGACISRTPVTPDWKSPAAEAGLFFVLAPRGTREDQAGCSASCGMSCRCTLRIISHSTTQPFSFSSLTSAMISARAPRSTRTRSPSL